MSIKGSNIHNPPKGERNSTSSSSEFLKQRGRGNSMRNAEADAGPTGWRPGVGRERQSIGQPAHPFPSWSGPARGQRGPLEGGGCLGGKCRTVDFSPLGTGTRRRGHLTISRSAAYNKIVGVGGCTSYSRDGDNSLKMATAASPVSIQCADGRIWTAGHPPVLHITKGARQAPTSPCLVSGPVAARLEGVSSCLPCRTQEMSEVPA